MPYNPGVQNRAGEFLAAGIQQAGQSIGQGFAVRAERKRDEKKESDHKAEASNRLRKALSIINPERKSEFAAMGHGDLMGEFDALSMMREQAKEKEAQAVTAQTKELNALKISESKQGIEGNERESKAIADFNELVGGAQVGGAPLTPEMLQGFANRARLNPDQQLKVAQAFRDFQAAKGDSATIEYQEDPVTGERFATYGKAMQSSGRNPQAPQAPVDAQPVNFDGKNVGLIVGQKFIPLADLQEQSTGTPKLEQLTDQNGRVIPGMFWDPVNRKPIREQEANAMLQAIQALTGNSPSGGQSGGFGGQKVRTYNKETGRFN